MTGIRPIYIAVCKAEKGKAPLCSDFQKRHFSSEYLKIKYLHVKFKLVRVGDHGGRLMIQLNDSMILAVPHNNFS